MVWLWLPGNKLAAPYSIMFGLRGNFAVQKARTDLWSVAVQAGAAAC